MAVTQVEHARTQVDGTALRPGAVLELVATPIAVVVALFYLAQQWGGREPGVESWALLAAGVALFSVRTRLRPKPTALALALSAAALLTLLTTGVLRGGAVAAGAYALAAALYLSVVAWARTPERRAALAAIVAASGAVEFAWAFVPWWGAGEVSKAMVGTYYWKNQFAAALLAPAVLGAWLALTGHPRYRVVGWIATPLACAGVVFSASRATTVLTALALAAVCLVCWLGVRSIRAAVKTLGLLVACALAPVLLSGPPLFTAPASGLLGQMGNAETLDTSWVDRIRYYQEAVNVFLGHPWGVGYGRFSAVATPQTPEGRAMSALVHDGPLQALVDGGLLLVVPLLVACALLMWAALRRLPVRRGATGDQLLTAAAAIAAIGLFGHSLFDFDWTYPALAAMFGVVCALTVTSVPASPAARGPWLHRLVVAGMLLVVTVAVVVTWGEQFAVNLA